METVLMKAGEAAYEKAASLLLSGQVVGIPTETVYGLAADARDPEAVGRIFEAKGRPQDNPLIVHIARFDQLGEVAREVPEAALRLGEAFWPGPLTMILRRSELIPDAVTAGLDTVGIRMPSHPAAREIIARSCPLAAPSANTSGKPSPTSATHVYDDMKGRVPLIVDGGRCRVGVESTVVDMTGGTPRVLRPGAITEEMIAAVLGDATTDQATRVGLAEGEKPKSPGMKYRHYAPKAPVILYEGAPDDTFAAVRRDYTPDDGIICFDEYKAQYRALGFRRVWSLGPSWDHAGHSRRVFSVLRHFDATNAGRILAQCPREYGAGEGTVNRLRKSAGFQCVACTEKMYIGVTGMSGAGKSLFCALLAEKRDDVLALDADQVYHELLDDPAGGLTAAILRAFPEADDHGAVDRAVLGRIIFNDGQKRAALNAMTHGAVLEKMKDIAAKSDRHYILLDVPLLFESGFDRACTMTVGLVTGRQSARKRIVARDSITEERASQRLGSQPTAAFYRRRCDLTVENTGSLDDLREAAAAFSAKYMPE